MEKTVSVVNRLSIRFSGNNKKFEVLNLFDLGHSSAYSADQWHIFCPMTNDHVRFLGGRGGGGGITRPCPADKGAVKSRGDLAARPIPTDVSKEREEKGRRIGK